MELMVGNQQDLHCSSVVLDRIVLMGRWVSVEARCPYEKLFFGCCRVGLCFVWSIRQTKFREEFLDEAFAILVAAIAAFFSHLHLYSLERVRYGDVVVAAKVRAPNPLKNARIKESV